MRVCSLPKGPKAVTLMRTGRGSIEPATFRIASERSTVKPHRAVSIVVGGVA